MTDQNTNTDDDQTDDQFDTSLDARAFDQQDDQGPPSACPGCGREVTLLGNGFCGFCQDQEGAADDVDDGELRTDGGQAADPSPHPMRPDDDDLAAVFQAAATQDGQDLYRCGDWLAMSRGDRVLAVSDGGDVRAVENFDAERFGVPIAFSGLTTVEAGDIDVEAVRVRRVVPDGGRNGPHPTTEPQGSDGQDGPVPRPVDARRAVVDAARKPGADIHRGAYAASRTTLDRWGDRQDVEAVVLKRKDLSGQRVAVLEVTPLTDLRDDLDLEADLSGQRAALPEDGFSVQDLFVDAAGAVSLPGLGVQPDGGRPERRRPNAKVIDPDDIDRGDDGGDGDV